MKTRKNIKNVVKKDILFIINRRRKKETLSSIKDFNTFMDDHALHRRRKHFCLYYLQPLSTEEILKLQIKYCFKSYGKLRIITPKKASMLESRIMREK